jgi:hypothetical protein
MSSLAVRVTPAVLLAATVLATAHCYAPTEVTVDISTDLSCADRLTTRVYKGSAGGGFEVEPEAETPNCTAEPSGAQIGTLVVVPSGSADGRAGIKAILSRNGKPPSDCTPENLADCIVATRGFSFVEHTSRRVPIRFLKDCIGTPCPEGQTCIAGGKCVSDQVTCEGTDCALPEERPATRDGGPSDPNPIRDASIDVPDLPLPDPTCLVNGGDTLFEAAGIPGPGLSVASADRIYFVPVDAPTKVLSIAKGGGAAVIAFEIAPGLAGSNARILAIAVDGPGVVVAYDDKNGVHHVNAAQTDSVIASSATPTAVFAAFDTKSIRVFVATPSELYEQNSGWNKLPVENVGGGRMAVDATTIFVASASSGIVSGVPRGVYSPVSTLPGPSTAMAYDGQSVYVAGGTASNKGVITKVSAPSVVVRSELPLLPQSLAVDAEFAYFSSNNVIARLPKTNTGAVGVPPTTIVAGAPGARIDHVAVDLMAAGCVYYWMKADPNAAKARLALAPKVRLGVLDGGP